MLLFYPHGSRERQSCLERELVESKEIMAEGKYVRLVRQGKWEYVERTSDRSAVVIVAVVGQHTAHKLVLVEQYRTAVDRRVIELPAGLVRSGGARWRDAGGGRGARAGRRDRL